MELGEFEIPAWVVGSILLVFLASLAYGVLIAQSLTAPIAVWIDILEVAVALFVVYLLYRFVVAVETIADEL